MDRQESKTEIACLFFDHESMIHLQADSYQLLPHCALQEQHSLAHLPQGTSTQVFHFSHVSFSPLLSDALTANKTTDWVSSRSCDAVTEKNSDTEMPIQSCLWQPWQILSIFKFLSCTSFISFIFFRFFSLCLCLDTLLSWWCLGLSWCSLDYITAGGVSGPSPIPDLVYKTQTSYTIKLPDHFLCVNYQMMICKVFSGALSTNLPLSLKINWIATHQLRNAYLDNSFYYGSLWHFLSQLSQSKFPSAWLAMWLKTSDKCLLCFVRHGWTETHIVLLYKATIQGDKSPHKRSNRELIAFQISMPNEKNCLEMVCFTIGLEKKMEFAARATVYETWEQWMESGS